MSCRCAERHVDGFNAQGLANTAWAFAKAGHCDPELFMALQNRMQHRLEDFNSQDIANTAWAFAKACHLDESFFTALARSAELCLNEFNTQDLVNTAWAFAKVGQFHPTLFGLIAQRGAERCLDGMDAPHIANMAWAFARAGQLDKHLFSALARSAEQRVGDFTSQDLANVAWAFTNAGHLEEQLFVALAKAAEKLLDDFDDEDLDNTEWAFTRAGQQRIVQQIRQRRRRTAGDVASTALPNVAVDVSGCGLIVVAGGGIGGAAAAVALQAKGFRVLVLESDSSFESRKQGYGLTIQRLDAAHALGISLSADDAPSTSHYTFSAEGHIINFYGEAFGVKSRDRREFENSGRFVHLPRQALRSRILQKIPPGTIRWNSKFKEFSCRTLDSCNKNGVTVTLTDGTVLNAALLVGSDGIFSTVRRQLDLPGDRLNYVGIVVVLGILDESVLPIPLARRRIFETVNGITRIYVMPFTPSSTMWQLSFPCDEGTARAFQKDASALKVEIMRRCGEWHDPIPDLLCNTPLDCMSGYPVYDRERLEPHGLRSPRKAIPEANVELEPQRRVTLIGDAAHPMTPFKAQGANQALVDAVLLADTLADSVNKYGPHAGFDVALPIFEQKMFTRTARVVIASREKAKELHSSLALQPARKAQRETGLNMKEVIRVLRDKGVVAQCASDPLGLDAVVADAIKYSGLGGGTTSLIAVEDKRFAQGQTELGDRIGEKAKKRKQKNGFSPMREAKRLGKDRSLPSTAAKARKVNEKQPVKEQVSALDAKDGNKSTVNPEVHNLETLTLRLLREAGNQGMRRLKLRKKVLRALTASGVSIKKAAVRERWEKLIGTRPSFKLDGEILYAA